MNAFPSAPRRLAALLLLSLLAACNSETQQGKPSADAGHDDDHASSTLGRLAISEAGATALRVYDLDKQAVAQSFTLAYAPSALYASPDRRYALAIQRTQDAVQIVDGGVWQEDHGDHLHDYAEAPRLLSYQINGVRPTHYETHDRLAALFMDGLVSSNSPAGVVTLSDASVAASRPEATLTLDKPMHGTAEPRGEYLLTTYRAPDNTDTLPSQVELYRRQGSSYQFVQRFDPPCPGLHGSYSNAHYSAFGCSDGVLLIHQDGANFTASKLANPADIGTGVRIGTITGHHEQARFVGIASPGHLFEIDPDKATITRINWATGRMQRGVAFDRHGKQLLVLDDQGSVHVLDSAAAWAKRSSLSVIASMPTASPFPSLAVSQSDDLAYLADPAGRQIAVIDIAQASLRAPLPLNFSPMGLTWLGIAHHDH